MRNKKAAVFLILFWVCSGAAARAETVDATLLQILANPVKYHYKVVRVTGYLHLQPYDDALYLHEEDYRHALFGNSIWVDATDDMRNHAKKLSGHYVVMEGFFDAERRGPMGVYTGTIRKIIRCETWSSDSMPANKSPDVVSTSGDN